jgi:hypothetical protein
MGRAKGTPNKRTQELLDEFEKRGWKRGPIEMMEMAHAEGVDPELKLACLRAATAYLESKPSPKPPLRFIEPSADLPKLVTATDASQFVSKVLEKATAGELDTDAAKFLIDGAKAFTELLVGVQLEGNIAKLQALLSGDQ